MNKTNNKWLSVIVAFALCLPLYAWNGSGTYEDPYEIATASDVADLVQAVNGGASQSGVYFLQTADIDLSSFGNFTPIGLPSAPFKGSYDGDGYFVSNLYVSANLASTATTNVFGFFGYVQAATIENLYVQGKVGVAADYNASACVGVGGVIGLSMGKSIFASIKNFVDIDFKLSNADIGKGSGSDIRYGVGGCVGLFGLLPKGANYTTLNIYYLENYGNIYADGINGYCCAGGVFSANNPNTDASTTLVGFGNHGKIICSGKSESDFGNNACGGGVASIHWWRGNGGTAGSPILSKCFNYGDVLCSNSISIAGIVSVGRSGGNHITRAEYCTNHANIVSINNEGRGRDFIGGVMTTCVNYRDGIVRNCVNFGDIKVFGNGTRVPQIGGVVSGLFGEAGGDTSYWNINFGDIEADCPNSVSVVVGGVSATLRKIYHHSSQNYGNIFVSTKGSALIGGAFAQASQGGGNTLVRNCVNYGSITAIGNSNTNYSPCVGGVFASTRLLSSATRNITISNCYSLGTTKLNLNDDGCYGAIYGVANTYGNYAVSIKNCYAIVGEGQNLIGAVDASNGNVSLENCVGIKGRKEGGIAYSVVGSNNWSQASTTLVSYDDCYHTPSLCLGNLPSGIFFPAEKSTNYFDLILPINTALYSTPSAENKKNHNYTKAQGYKRYIKTIQQ